MLRLCREAAEKVQVAIKPLAGTEEADTVSGPSAGGGQTKKIDKVAEKVALEVLEKSKIPMLVLSEEIGTITLGKNPEYICVMDPVDGTYNAIRGVSIYAFSIAFATYKESATVGDIKYALVRNLVTGDTFEAEKNKGAKLNGKNISATKDEKLEGSAVCIYMQHTNIEKLKKLVGKPKRIRALGCAALELCHVAKGDYHSFVDLRKMLRVTDIAAGKLILEEAGGVVADEFGNTLKTSILKIDRASIIASGNIKIQKEVIDLIRS